MNKPLPNWAMWKHVPQLRDVEAIALSLDLDPRKVYEWSKNKWVYSTSRGLATTVSEFADRLFLFRKCFGLNAKTRPEQFAAWAKSIGWIIPAELEASAVAVSPTAGAVQASSSPISHMDAPPATTAPEIDEVGVKRREQQIREIEKVAKILGYDILQVPTGGKPKLMEVCQYGRPDLFGSDEHSFTAAWKEARKQERVKMADHEKFVNK